MEAVRLTAPITLDGTLQEESWNLATPATVFTQLDPLEGEPATEATRIYVLYDDEALYIGAILYDRSPVSTRLGRRDGFLRDSDWLTISLDTYNDNRTGFRFKVNPSGVRGDEALSGGQDWRGDSSWDPVWEARAQITEEGWTAEIRIPFGQLRFRNAEDQLWGIQISRDTARNREKQIFSFTPKEQAGGIARYGDLRGIRGIRQGGRLEVLPYVQGRAEFIPVPQDEDVSFSNPFRDGSDFFFETGFDLKYRLTSNLTVDATVNPDFGQVEVDPAVVNLTAFETRYQEKRPFFVEGAGIFSFGQGGGGGGGGGGEMGGGGSPGGVGGPRGGGGGGEGEGPTQLLYSRRIGDPPPGDLPGESVYGDAPEATTILGAAKLTGQTTNGWAVGLLEAMTGREMADYVEEDGVRGEADVAPRANYFVARVRKDFREGQSSLGGIGTAVNRDFSDPALEAELRSSAYTAGIDFFHEWGNRTWALSGQMAGSRIGGSAEAMEDAQTSSARYYQRPDAHHIEFDPTATSLTGYTANLELRRQAGLHWRGNVQFTATSPGFEVNDLGYQRDADRREAEARIEYQENRPGEVFRRYTVSLQPRAFWNFNGDRLGTSVSARANLTFLNYWSVNGSYERQMEVMDDRLTRGGPLALKPGGHQVFLSASTDVSRSYSGRLSLRGKWDEAGGREASISGRLTLKPSSRVDISLSPRISLSETAAQYVDDVTDGLATPTLGTRYVFAELEQTTVSIETRLNLTFSPDLTLELFAQPFLASGDYGSLKELVAPGTFEFACYGVDRGTILVDGDGDSLIDPDGSGPASSFTISNRDFNRVSLRVTAVMRWEWRPGSTLFLVWQQSRSESDDRGDFNLGRDAGRMFSGETDNVFMLKATYWFGS